MVNFQIFVTRIEQIGFFSNSMKRSLTNKSPSSFVEIQLVRLVTNFLILDKKKPYKPPYEIFHSQSMMNL
jgi:hypothetical protein